MEHSLKVWILLINSQNLFKYYFWILIPSYSKFSFVVVASWLPRGKCQKKPPKKDWGCFHTKRGTASKAGNVVTIVWWFGVINTTGPNVWRQVVWLTVCWCQISGKSNWQLQCDADTGEQKGDLGLTSGAWQVCSESHRQMRWQPHSSETALYCRTLGHAREDFTATWQSVGQNHHFSWLQLQSKLFG